MSVTKTELQKVSESNVQKACTDLLSAKKCLWFRMNAGDRLAEYNGKKYRIRGHAKGTADLMAFVYFPRQGRSTALFLEIKSPTGRQTPEQKAFERDVLGRGMCYLLIRSIDELIAWFQERGL